MKPSSYAKSLLFLLVCRIEVITTIKCYDCRSKRPGDPCKQVFYLQERYIKDCPNERCYTIEYASNEYVGDYNVQRGCMGDNFPYIYDSYRVVPQAYRIMCNFSLCNYATHLFNQGDVESGGNKFLIVCYFYVFYLLLSTLI